MQMEEEHDERQKLVREKRDLERQMQALSEQKPAQDRGLLRYVSVYFWSLMQP